MTTDMKNLDGFWVKNPMVLLDKYLSFIPTSKMTRIQLYNAVTLYCVYAIILMIIFGVNCYWIAFPLFVIILVVIFGSLGNISDAEKFDTVIETGFLDSDNNVVQFNRVNGEKTIGSDVSYTCIKPTNDNPFMNPNVNDYNNIVPAACNSDDDNINNEVKKSFTSNSYYDIDDVFDKMNSQRQFYTVPNTAIPNDQTNFAKWLYLSPKTCKEDQEMCLRYEDLKYKR